jgi:hypothetical protein
MERLLVQQWTAVAVDAADRCLEVLDFCEELAAGVLKGEDWCEKAAREALEVLPQRRAELHAAKQQAQNVTMLLLHDASTAH